MTSTVTSLRKKEECILDMGSGAGIYGLLRSGALKEEDRPMWYDVYKAFPPFYEPRYDRPAPDAPVKNIFYAEDVIRAKFHKENKSLPAVNLSDQKLQTLTQKFIVTYNRLKEEGGTPEENLYAAASDVVNAGRYSAEDKLNLQKQDVSELKTSMASSFKEAKRDQKLETNVNIKDIFKD